MALVAPLEGLDETLASQQGLKRLVKGSKKRSRTPEKRTSAANDASPDRSVDKKRPKTGLKLKIKLNGSLVASRAVTPQTSLAQKELLSRIIPASRQAELDALGLPDDKLIPAFQPQWRSSRKDSQPESRQLDNKGVRVREPLALSQPQLRRKEPSGDAPGVQMAAGRNDLPLVPTQATESQDKTLGLKQGQHTSLHGCKVPDAHASSKPSSAVRPDTDQLDQRQELPPRVVASRKADHADNAGSQQAGVPDTADAAGSLLSSGQDGPEPEPLLKLAEQPRGLQILKDSSQSSIRPADNAKEERREVAHQEPAVASVRNSLDAQPVTEANKPVPKQMGAKQAVPKAADGAEVVATNTRIAKEEGEVEKEDSKRASSSSSSDKTTSSSSTSSSSSSDSESETDSLQRGRGEKRGRSPSHSKTRSRSREAGEHSADEYPAGHRFTARRATDEERSRSRHSRSPSKARSRSKSRYADYPRDYRRHYDSSRKYETSRKYERSRHDDRRYSVERGDSRRREVETRHRPRSPARSGLRDSPRAQDGGHTSSSRQSRPERSNGLEARTRSRLGPAPRTALQALPEEEKPAADEQGRDKRAKQESERQRRQPSQPEAVLKPIGFADAWNMLHGAGRENWGSDTEIDELHLAATNAKRTIENISKATNGKHTFENLVALMRDSYLKYMQVGAMWEMMIRLPNPNPNRTRAKLADEGGMFPQTIVLMRQIAADCRTCPANTEASKILRCLAERLAAIIQMRVVHIQRAKVAQDRQILLACKGSPRVDAYGRRTPGPEIPGETYQRPSPTDSNASNNTSEQAVHQVPSPRQILPGRATTAVRPASSGAASASAAAPAVARGVKGARPQPERKTTPVLPRGEPLKSKAKKPMPAPTGSGRDDAWAIEPLPWEIPPKHFDSEMRSWNILGGFMNFTAVFKSHLSDIEGLMQIRSESVREAAGMLGFLDLGLGLTNIGVVLQLSQDILTLVLKIQGSSAEAAPKN